MPLLSLQLKYSTSTASKAQVVLTGAIPKQPIKLVGYQIKLSSVDATVDTLYVTLPFLNSYDVNSNFIISNAIPLFHDTTLASSHTRTEIEFNPARNIDESMTEWNVYDEDGNIYVGKSYTITLLFNYRRAELI